MVERGAPGSGGSRQDWPSNTRSESTKKRKHGGGIGEPRRWGVSPRRIQLVEAMDHTIPPEVGGSQSVGQSAGGATSGWAGTI